MTTAHSLQYRDDKDGNKEKEKAEQTRFYWARGWEPQTAGKLESIERPVVDVGIFIRYVQQQKSIASFILQRYYLEFSENLFY